MCRVDACAMEAASRLDGSMSGSDPGYVPCKATHMHGSRSCCAEDSKYIQRIQGVAYSSVCKDTRCNNARLGPQIPDAIHTRGPGQSYSKMHVRRRDCARRTLCAHARRCRAHSRAPLWLLASAQAVNSLRAKGHWLGERVEATRCRASPVRAQRLTRCRDHGPSSGSMLASSHGPRHVLSRRILCCCYGRFPGGRR